jgi:hypothetical protein
LVILNKFFRIAARDSMAIAWAAYRVVDVSRKTAERF